MKIPKAIQKLQLKVQRMQTPSFQKKVMKFLFQQKEIRDLIIKLNTIDQLYRKGINSLGESLGEYTDYTKTIKQDTGQRYDHITLNDTGAFYNSFRVVFRADSLVIEANPIKDDTNLFTEFGIEILGLTEESIGKLKPTLIKFLLPELKKYFLKGKQSQLN